MGGMNLHLNRGDRVVLADHGFGTVAEILPVGYVFMARVALDRGGEQLVHEHRCVRPDAPRPPLRLVAVGDRA